MLGSISRHESLLDNILGPLAGLLEFSNSMSPLLSDNDGFFEYGQLVQYEWWPLVNRWNGAVTTGALWGTATTIWRSSTG